MGMPHTHHRDLPWECLLFIILVQARNTPCLLLHTLPQARTALLLLPTILPIPTCFLLNSAPVLLLPMPLNNAHPLSRLQVITLVLAKDLPEQTYLFTTFPMT